jgi:tetratricopeptide (TPR) repeat protein
MSEDQDPLSASDLRDRALDHIRAGSYGSASEDLKNAVENNPDDALSLTLLGGVKLVLGEPEEALAHLERAHGLEPDNADRLILRLRGAALRRTGDPHSALVDLSSAIELDTNDMLTLVLRGDTYMSLGRYAEADADLRTAADLDSHIAENSTLLEPGYIILALRGDCKRRLGNYPRARWFLMRASIKKPGNKFIILTFCDVLNRLDNSRSARDGLQIARHLFHGDSVFTVLLAEAHKLCGDYATALRELRGATGNPDAYFLQVRGDIKRMQGKLRGALRDLDRADTLKPNNAFTYKIRGSVQGRLGRYNEALLDLDHASSLEPTDNFIRARIDEIEEERENSRGCTLRYFRCIREVITRVEKICGHGDVVETTLLAPLPDICITELCDLEKLLVKQMLAEMTGLKAVLD